MPCLKQIIQYFYKQFIIAFGFLFVTYAWLFPVLLLLSNVSDLVASLTEVKLNSEFNRLIMNADSITISREFAGSDIRILFTAGRIMLLMYSFVVLASFHMRLLFRLFPLSINENKKSIMVTFLYGFGYMFTFSLTFYSVYIYINVVISFLLGIGWQSLFQITGSDVSFRVITTKLFTSTIQLDRHRIESLCVCLFALSYLATVGHLMFRQYIKQSEYRIKDHVLFLRRFSSYADRVILSVILRSISRRGRFSGTNTSRVVCLVPQNEPASNIDPYMICLSGFNLIHPFRNIPLYIRTSNDLWEDTVHRYLENAKRVIIDLSDLSSSMMVETRMLLAKNMVGSTMFLASKSSLSFVSTTLDNVGIGSGRTLVTYYDSWRRAVLRFILEIFVSLGCTITPIYLYVISDSFRERRVYETYLSLRRYFGSNFNWESHNIDQLAGSVLLAILLLTVSGFIVPYFITVFIKPSIDGESSAKLRSFLKSEKVSRLFWQKGLLWYRGLFTRFILLLSNWWMGLWSWMILPFVGLSPIVAHILESYGIWKRHEPIFLSTFTITLSILLVYGIIVSAIAYGLIYRKRWAWRMNWIMIIIFFAGLMAKWKFIAAIWFLANLTFWYKRKDDFLSRRVSKVQSGDSC